MGVVLAAAAAGQDAPRAEAGGRPASIFDISVRTLAGEDTTLAACRGRVLLIVNVASRCGFTPQYEELQAPYERFADRGFLLLRFPANNFMNQEPGTNEEIMEFCRVSYGVTFPMFEKISVAGKDQHPLYAYLTSKDTNHDHGGEITWNFSRFLVGRDGRILDRFGPRTKPLDPELVSAVEKALAEPWNVQSGGEHLAGDRPRGCGCPAPESPVAAELRGGSARSRGRAARTNGGTPVR